MEALTRVTSYEVVLAPKIDRAIAKLGMRVDVRRFFGLGGTTCYSCGRSVGYEAHDDGFAFCAGCTEPPDDWTDVGDGD